ncbi:MAG TPA: hypothetical protein VMF91_05825 [Bryobacteraceae bacterium]|nr:hypothetical protein [Bryobacteraceae bacterium]
MSGNRLRLIHEHKEDASMTQTKFPEGWDEEKVQRVLAHYENQSYDDAAAEEDAAMDSSETVVSVPRDLLPQIRELIAKHRG